MEEKKRFRVMMSGLFAVIGFLAALVVGLIAQRDTAEILKGALWTGVAMYFVGMVVGVGGFMVLGEMTSKEAAAEAGDEDEKDVDTEDSPENEDEKPPSRPKTPEPAGEEF